MRQDDGREHPAENVAVEDDATQLGEHRRLPAAKEQQQARGERILFNLQLRVAEFEPPFEPTQNAGLGSCRHAGQFGRSVHDNSVPQVRGKIQVGLTLAFGFLGRHFALSRLQNVARRIEHHPQIGAGDAACRPAQESHRAAVAVSYRINQKIAVVAVEHHQRRPAFHRPHAQRVAGDVIHKQKEQLDDRGGGSPGRQ